MHRTKFERAHLSKRRDVLSACTLSAREQCISERARPVLCESKGNPHASREIRAQAGRFALAHYINLLSRCKNALSTFGSKITPYASQHNRLSLSTGHLSTRQFTVRDLSCCIAPHLV